MAAHTLSEFTVRSAKAIDKTLKMADGYGFYLEVTPRGSKLWRYRYRFEGRHKLISLGVYPVVSLAEARAAHLKCRKILHEGIDPSANCKAKKTAKYAQESNRFEVVTR